MELKYEESKNRFYLLDNDKEIGEITYANVKDGLIDINHTEIDVNYRGQDLGLQLIEAIADYARENKLKARASCPYVAKVFGETDKYDDIKA
ncbi:putative acetyltransferase [Winogradskyella psychrotolerans RS-3]|uniref:Putative acetyltransferase n=1 Tax=Winogradskyella psychrotolerans RS-3 TaxID=641526 RepID=S7VKU5_9FLAO|nr:GNAT family N-acetyltransferase [Winogradskyella psychrotolerans]EPR70780.1 putative acetyltransferase [Winogradskyella psychrotolerans RS-3]